MKITIPAKGILDIKVAIFDFNGTLALDGVISAETKEQLIKLAELMDIYILTADTNGTAANECKGLPVILKCFSQNASAEKAKIISELGEVQSVCFGNGFNDIEMFKLATLSVAILGQEGTYAKLLLQADIVVKDINDGISLLTNTNRIIADLRN